MVTANVTLDEFHERVDTAVVALGDHPDHVDPRVLNPDWPAGTPFGDNTAVRITGDHGLPPEAAAALEAVYRRAWAALSELDELLHAHSSAY